ncbi:variant 3, Serine carboxypeptidase-like 48 [Lathyrus oleraceus]|uniref:Carboxypeptidase n=1 Tax=Pisum sativum TaxID=3888 RepID=A0A9D5A104_PEA|nr:variant 3, Serine carboxypeptidase-like 48 [Pisum sativum]
MEIKRASLRNPFRVLRFWSASFDFNSKTGSLMTDIPTDGIGVSNDLYAFLQAFFKEHPQLVKNDFYITGESYAGHYIPALASRVHKGNKNKEGNIINFKGFAIGNGLTNPEIQYPAYTQFAVDNKLITKEDQADINKLIPFCVGAAKNYVSKGGESYETALQQCQLIFTNILAIAGNINVSNRN